MTLKKKIYHYQLYAKYISNKHWNSKKSSEWENYIIYFYELLYIHYIALYITQTSVYEKKFTKFKQNKIVKINKNHAKSG